MHDEAGKPLHERVARALDGAGDLTGTALIEHLERSHGDDLELLAEVRSLLGTKKSVPLLDEAGPAQELARKLQDRLLTSELFTRGGTPRTGGESRQSVPMPRRVGGYDIHGVIGEGGMGVVYEAMQASPHRRVAVKMLSTTAPTRSSLARFRREAEVLGRLKHPGIAQVFEAATDPASGAAFFAMEFVNGPPLTAFAEARQLTLAQRVELLARVCDATQHAHQAGVIHRDLKPSNILVEDSGDGAGQPKVLDFGVASLTREAEQSATIALDAGKIIGTLGYMPPEAVDGGASADTRSDIYSLGVILYELLTGKLPVEVRGASLTEAARRIRETPPAPLPGLSGGNERGMCDDLDLIVRKALAKETSLRYASAAEFAADLRRCLAHEPVLARAPSTWYTLRKFIRRRRGVSTLVAASFLVVTGAAVVASVQSLRANRALASEAEQRALAERKREEAERGQYRAAIAAAVAAMRTQTPVDARKSLSDAPERLRGWEWAYLSQAVTPGRAVPLDEPVRSAEPFAGGERVMSETRTAPVRTIVWDAASAMTLQTHPLRGASTLEDGSLLTGVDASGHAVCQRANGQTLWQVAPPAGTTWRSTELFEPSPGEPIRVALFGDFTVMSVDAMSGATHWTLTSQYPNERAAVERTSDPQKPILFSMWQRGPNQERVRVDALRGEWVPFDSRVRQATPTVNLGVGFSWTLFYRLGEEYPGRPAPQDAVWSAAVTNTDASTLAVGDTRGVVSMYTRDPLNPQAYVDAGTLPMGSGMIQQLAFVRGEREIVSVDQTGAVRIAPALTPAMPWRTTADRNNRPGPIAPDSSFAVSIGWGFVSVCDTLTGLPLWRANLGRTFPQAVAVSPDSKTIAWFGDRDGEMGEFFVLDAKSGRQLVGWSTSPFTIDPRNGFSATPWRSTVRAASFDPTGRMLLVALADGSVRVIDTTTWTMLEQPTFRVTDDALRIQSLVHSPDGGHVALLTGKMVDGTLAPRPIEVLDARTLGSRARLEADEPSYVAAWSRDGTMLLTGHARGVVHAWDVPSGGHRWRTDLGTSDNLTALAVSVDGSRIAAAALGPQMHLLDSEGRAVAILPNPAVEVRGLRFSEDDELLATAVRTHVLRFATGDRERDTWTPQAIASWPGDVPRPDSLMEARRLIEQPDALVAKAWEDLRPMKVRRDRITGAVGVDERARVLALRWFDRLGANVNWGNSDALVLMRDQREDRQSLEYARDILLELIALKPHAFNLRSNLAEAYRLLGDTEQAIAMMLSAEERLAVMSPDFDALTHVQTVEFYVKVRSREHAMRVLSDIDERIAAGSVRELTPTLQKQLDEARRAAAALKDEDSPSR